MYVIIVLAIAGIRHTSAVLYRIPLKHSKGATNEAVQEEGVIEVTADNLHGKPGEGYYIEMGLGTPPQFLNILVDTGSSNFAVAAAHQTYISDYFDTDRSTTFVPQATEVYVPYTQGTWRGHLGKDFVFVPSLANFSVKANIACIKESENFFMNGSHWEGILGLAYSEIARPNPHIEPYFDSLVSQTGTNDSFSMQLCGTIDLQSDIDVSMGGTMVIGGIDDTLYLGDMFYATIHKQWYYEVIVTDIEVNGRSLNMDCKEYNFDKTIVDSGTTNLRLPRKVFREVVYAIRDNTHLSHHDDSPPPDDFWDGSSLLCWEKGHTPWSLWPYLVLTLAESHNSTFKLAVSPQQYLRAVVDIFNNNKDCFKFAVAPSDTGMVLGAVVMEGFYVVFDRANQRVGFAKSTCPNRDSSTASNVQGPFYNHDTFDCAYIKPKGGPSTLVTVAYVMAGICGACMIPLILMIAQWQWKRCHKPKQEIADIDSLLRAEEDKSESQ